MTEAEWLADPDGRQLLNIEQYATLRKLRLIAAAYIRCLQTESVNEDTKPCDDMLEAVADQPRPWDELMDELWGRSGESWRFTHVLARDEAAWVAKELRKLVALGPPPRHESHLIHLIHEVIGNPFRPVALDPAWRTDTAVSLARGMYESRDFSAMPILADALQDAGCDNEDVLSHCRDPKANHVRGCWVVDLVLGKG